MNHNQHDDQDDYEDYEGEELDEDLDDEDMDEEDELSDREGDLEDVRDQVAELTAGLRTLTLSAEDGVLPAIPADASGYGAVVAEFCWSRLKREQQDGFLAQLKKASGKNALLVLLDEVYVEGASNPVARTDAQGNTYELVSAADGARIERPMSYPTDSALRKRLANAANQVRVARWEYFWVLTGKFK